MVANVYQYNNDYQRLVTLALKQQPDTILLVETDKAWQSGIAGLEKMYNHKILLPMDNTYGMLFYSKLPIVQHEVMYLIHDDIPSIKLTLLLESGDEVLMICIHPKPPMPQHSKESSDRDAEILLAGKMAKAYGGPSIIMGDLNDVAWSHTTRIFLRTSSMADPRRGRGLFSTFHAKVPFFRWPLDHIFLSHHFGVVNMQVLDSIGSDHFPIWIKAAITPQPTATILHADEGDVKEANEKIAEGSKKATQ